MDDLLPPEHYNYLVAFRTFNAVVSSCFSYELDPDYMRYIEEFKNAWFALNLPITCKMHLLIAHLPEELEKYGMGTALFNESAGIFYLEVVDYPLNQSMRVRLVKNDSLWN